MSIFKITYVYCKEATQLIETDNPNTVKSIFMSDPNLIAKRDANGEEDCGIVKISPM